MEERLARRGGDEVCSPEVINLHQKSNNVKMSFQHLQLSEPVFRLFLSNAQHGAFLHTPERKHETGSTGSSSGCLLKHSTSPFQHKNFIILFLITSFFYIWMKIVCSKCLNTAVSPENFFRWYFSNMVIFFTQENLCKVVVKQLSRANYIHVKLASLLTSTSFG